MVVTVTGGKQVTSSGTIYVTCSSAVVISPPVASPVGDQLKIGNLL
jgi:hypothetical protein